MKGLRLLAGTVMAVAIGLGSPSAAQRVLYTEGFSQSGTSLADLGFESIQYWLRDDSLAVMKTATPGGWGALARVTTAPINADRSAADVRISWNVRFPTANTGPSWRENNKIWVTLLDGGGQPAYEFLFKPNRNQDRYTSFDMELTKFVDGQASVLAQGFSHKLTPSGPAAKRVSFILVFSTNGGISVQYDAADGDGAVEYIAVTDTEHETFSKLRFTYKTGTASGNYFAEVDNIDVVGESTPPTDDDGDGVPDAVETVLGTDPHSSGDAPVVAVPTTWEVCPRAPTNVWYDYSAIPGYGSRTAVKVSVPGDVLAGNLAPIVTVADPAEYNGETPAIPDGFQVIGSVLSVHAALQPDRFLPIALALPDIIPNGVADRFFQLYHYVDDAWREVPLRNVTDQAIHFVGSSFSPFVVAANMSGVVYVDQSVTASGDGTTWDQAKKTLVEGLQAAGEGQEIWVAEGTYYPSLTPTTEVDRTKRFQLGQNQRLVGGFPVDGSTLQARNVSPRQTILSGDIGAIGDNADNCYNVLLVGWATGVTIEGVTIEAANSVGSAYSLAGGLWVTGAQATIRNCIFRNNHSGEGAGIGMYEYSEVTVEDCRFVDNSANYGGALCSYIAGTPLTVSRCHFNRNMAAVDGGALYISNGTSTSAMALQRSTTQCFP